MELAFGEGSEVAPAPAPMKMKKPSKLKQGQLARRVSVDVSKNGFSPVDTGHGSGFVTSGMKSYSEVSNSYKMLDSLDEESHTMEQEEESLPSPRTMKKSKPTNARVKRQPSICGAQLEGVASALAGELDASVKAEHEADDAKARPAASLSPTGASAALQFGADGSVKMSKVKESQLDDDTPVVAGRANDSGAATAASPEPAPAAAAEPAAAAAAAVAMGDYVHPDFAQGVAAAKRSRRTSAALIERTSGTNSSDAQQAAAAAQGYLGQVPKATSPKPSSSNGFGTKTKKKATQRRASRML